MRSSERRSLVLILVSLLVLASVPAFFEIYRTAAFNTIPHDDYAPYLLTMMGRAHSVPPPPYAYRFVSVAIAIPFHLLLPTTKFSYLKAVDPEYLRATQALSFVAWLALLVTSGIIYRVSREAIGASRAASLVVAMVGWMLASFTNRTAIDAVALLAMAGLLALQRRRLWFAGVMLLTVVGNEKVPLVWASLLAARAIAARLRRERFAWGPQLVAAAVSVAAYALMVGLWRVPGNEQQTDPSHFLSAIRATVAESFSTKGVFLNLLPVSLVLVIAALAARTRSRTGFEVADVAGVLVLIAISSVADVQRNVGRIAMYAFPLYLPATARVIDDLLSPDDEDVASPPQRSATSAG